MSSSSENSISRMDHPAATCSSPSSSDQQSVLSRRLRIDEIKERRRRFHKETAERWILEQQFGGSDHSSNGSAPEQPIFETTAPPLPRKVIERSENFIKISSRRTEEKTAAAVSITDNTKHVEMRNAGAERDVTVPSTTPTKPLTDRNSFLNAFEFFSRGGGGSGGAAGSPEDNPTEDIPPPLPKPRSVRGSVPNIVSERTGVFCTSASTLVRSGSAGSNTQPPSKQTTTVRTTLLKFQHPQPDHDNTTSEGATTSPNNFVKRRSALRLDWEKKEDDTSTSSTSVRTKVGIFVNERRRRGNATVGIRDGELHLRDQYSQGKPISSSSSPPPPPFPTSSQPFLHSPPPPQSEASTPEEENSSSSTNSSSSSSHDNTTPPSNSSPPGGTPSSSSSALVALDDTQHREQTEEDHNLSSSSPLKQSNKRPSIPDILVLDPIVIITEDGGPNTLLNSGSSSSDNPATGGGVTAAVQPPTCSRRRPSSILKKRDSTNTSTDDQITNASTVSFAACVDDEEGNSSGRSRDPSKTEPYRRRSRSYSGSSSGVAGTSSHYYYEGGSTSGGAVPDNTRRRNSAEAHYYGGGEDFPPRHGILKHSCSSLSVDGSGSTSSGAAHSDSEFKSILKQPALRRSSLGSNIHTVHQTRFSDDFQDFDDDDDDNPPPHQHRSILKRKSSTSSSQPDVSTTSSLRSTASSYCSSRESLHEPDPKPILKKKSSSEEISDSDYNSTSITPPPPRPILKNKHSTPPLSSESIPILVCSDQQVHPIKPCLKKPCKSFDESALWCSNTNNGLESTSSIIRKSSPHICSVKRCEEDSNKSEEDDDEDNHQDPVVHPQKSVLFTRRRDSEPFPTSPTTMEDPTAAGGGATHQRRGSASTETFNFKRKIELGKIDFSNLYDAQTHQSSSEATSPSSGISSPTNDNNSAMLSASTTPSGSSPKKSSNAITERIAALQISGESSWKKRVFRRSPEDDISSGGEGQADKPTSAAAAQASRERQNNGILANRLSMLESSQESWRKRVCEKDAKEFTVQGKLERAGKKVIPTSPGITSTSGSDEDATGLSKKKTTSSSASSSSSFKNVFRGMRGSKTDESIVKSSVVGGGAAGNCVMIAYSKKEEDSFSSAKNAAFQRSKSMRYGRVSVSSASPSQDNSSSESSSSSSQGQQQQQTSASQHVITVPVHQNDNETFTRFFESSTGLLEGSGQANSVSSVVVEDDSFNSIIRGEESRQLLGNKRSVKVARNKDRHVKNPVKALAGRMGLQSYVDVNPEIRERENIRRRIQMENSTSATHAHLSIEALAGLASKEDFTSVKLRRAQQEISAQYPYPLLIRVKGKRFVQTRLAAPEVSSINSGDNFILITQTKLYHFIGEYSNRMERSKSLDVVAHVVQKKEFGCSLHTTVITLQEECSGGSPQWDSFFEVLGSKERSIRDDPELLGDEADEDYEGKVISRNKVWRVITGDELDEKLIPLREHWGMVPKHGLLEATEVLIFDFGPEMYVWSGSKAPVDKKKLGYRLAQQMFEMEGLAKEFDDVKGSSGVARKGKQDQNGDQDVRRPSWCWLRKVNQHMEPILFIEKFFDWPEEIGRIRVGKNVKNSPGGGKKGADGDLSVSSFVPCEPAELSQSYQEEQATAALVLEGFDVKRGRVVVDQLERRNYTITTTRVQTWAISEFSKSEVPDSQLGHFNSGSTYVIRWQYSILFVGKDLKGNQSKHNASTVGGRDRCAYFFWHGKRSKITEQGASALMTVELDDQEERRDCVSGPSSLGGGGCNSRGPQVRVEQNYEPPAFLSLFNGKLFIHDPQVNGEETTRKSRLYVTLGTDEEEAHFLEVACSPDSFRRSGCFLLFDVDNRVVFLWIGSDALADVKQFALAGASSTIKNSNWSPSITKVVTVKQSHETDAFWSCLVGTTKKAATSAAAKWTFLLPTTQTSVEMFRFTSINGTFEAIPVVSPRRGVGLTETFPVVQEDLYGASVSQPSIFLFLSPDSIVYLWQGWRRTIKREFIPEDDDLSQQAVDSIPLTTVWPKYRRCSVETALAFARFKNVQTAYQVYAGIEPEEFTQLFPYWDVHIPAVKEAHDYHIAEGKSVGERVPLISILEELTAKRMYTVEELLEKPEGVDLSRLEDYVCDEDFERLFSMPRTQFAQLQAWRKTELKKAVGLF